jgi:hypothetical protein
MVEQATAKFAIPIVFVDSRCLKDEALKAVLARLRQQKWHGGIVLPADKADKSAVRIVKAYLSELKEADSEGATSVVVRDGFGPKDLRTSIDSVHINIEGRILRTGNVERKPQQKGRESRPHISNNPG